MHVPKTTLWRFQSPATERLPQTVMSTLTASCNVCITVSRVGKNHDFFEKNRNHRFNRLNWLNQRLNPYILRVYEIEDFLACIIWSTGLVNSNMLSEFLRLWRELPWQPNLGKISQNCTYFRKKLAIFHINSRLFRVSEFMFAIWIFKGAKGVAMATKFRYNCTNSVCIKY